MAKWLLVYQEGDGKEPLYFCVRKGLENPVWAPIIPIEAYGSMVFPPVDPVHFERANAETLAFNFIMYDEKYIGRLEVVECATKGCSKCSGS